MLTPLAVRATRAKPPTERALLRLRDLSPTGSVEVHSVEAFFCPFCGADADSVPYFDRMAFQCRTCHRRFWARCLPGGVLCTSTDNPTTRASTAP